MRSILTLIALLAVLAGCGSNPSGVTVEFDMDLQTAIVELPPGESRPLKELAPGDWTTVHVLRGPRTGGWIEKELGRPVQLDGDGTYDGDYIQEGNLLVFQRDGEIVRMVSLGQLAAIANGVCRADVVLRVQDNNTIEMVYPD